MYHAGSAHVCLANYELLIFIHYRHNCAFRSEILRLRNGNRLLETAVVLFRTSFALLEPISLQLV